MNHIKNLSNLKNNYLGIRHGQSLANQEGIIISDPANGVGNYGLTKEGQNQVRLSVQGHLESSRASTLKLNTNTLIIHSDFKRAHETAKLVHEPVSYTHLTLPTIYSV